MKTTRMVSTVLWLAAMWPCPIVAGAQRLAPVAVRQSAASAAAPRSASDSATGQRPSMAKYMLAGAGIGALATTIAWVSYAQSLDASDECLGCPIVLMVGGTVVLSALLGALVGLLVWAARY